LEQYVLSIQAAMMALDSWQQQKTSPSTPLDRDEGSPEIAVLFT
jgi:hypothetical protein